MVMHSEGYQDYTGINDENQQLSCTRFKFKK